MQNNSPNQIILNGKYSMTFRRAAACLAQTSDDASDVRLTWLSRYARAEPENHTSGTARLVSYFGWAVWIWNMLLGAVYLALARRLSLMCGPPCGGPTIELGHMGCAVFAMPLQRGAARRQGAFLPWRLDSGGRRVSIPSRTHISALFILCFDCSSSNLGSTSSSIFLVKKML
jgi:hypothetical protein